MANTNNYGSLIIQKRDVGIDMVEDLKVLNNRLVLTEIPNALYKVNITGYVEKDMNGYKLGTKLNANEFIVDYGLGIVVFSSSVVDNTLVHVVYKGMGYVMYPASRIYYHNTSQDIIDNLQNVIDKSASAIDTVNNLTKNIETGNTLKTDLDNRISSGNMTKSNLDSSISSANTSKTNLDNSTSTANATKNSLDTSISTANTTKTDLDNSNTTANTTKTNLTNINTTATTTNSTLTTTNTTATNTNTTLNNTITSANTAKTNLDGSISTATTTKTNLDTSVTNATNINNTLGVTTTNGQTKIQEIDNMVHLGAYNNSTAYKKRNMVSYNGSTYICILDSTGNLPTNTTYWTLVAQKGIDGTGSIVSIGSSNGDLTVTGTTNLDLSISKKGQANGVATLDGTGKIPLTQIPNINTQIANVVTNPSDRLALKGMKSGDICYETSTGKAYIYDGTQWIILADKDWQNINLQWSNVTGTPTTLSGYNITDGVSKTVPTVSGDLNTYTTTGFYYVPTNTTSSPTTTSYNLIVNSNGTQVTQTVFNGSTIYSRTSTNNGTSWSGWYSIITFNQLTSIPSSSTTTALSPRALYDLGFVDSAYSVYNTAGSDLNTYSTSSAYRYFNGTGTIVNLPASVSSTSVPFWLIQYRVDSNNYVQQIMTAEATPRFFMRTKTSGIWNVWTQTIDSTQKGIANGIPSLDGNSLVPTVQLPTSSITSSGIVQLEDVSTSNSTSKVPTSNQMKLTNDKIGILSNLNTTTKNDLVSAVNEHLAEKATVNKASHVKPDGVTTTVDANGTISAAPQIGATLFLYNNAWGGF